DRLGPKGTGPGYGAPNSPYAGVVPPAERRGLTRAGPSAERGKPVAFPPGKRAVRPADGAAGRGGGSKRKPRCNGADRGCDSTPPERELTSLWSGGTRESGQPLWEAEQMSAAARLAGAASPGNRRRPRVSIVQVCPPWAVAPRPARGVCQAQAACVERRPCSF